MSADNYEVIRKVPEQPGRYFVTSEFASDDEWDTDEEAWTRKRLAFKLLKNSPDAEPSTYTLKEAQDYAESEYSEYGVVFFKALR